MDKIVKCHNVLGIVLLRRGYSRDNAEAQENQVKLDASFSKKTHHFYWRY